MKRCQQCVAGGSCRHDAPLCNKAWRDGLIKPVADWLSATDWFALHTAADTQLFEGEVQHLAWSLACNLPTAGLEPSMPA